MTTLSGEELARTPFGLLSISRTPPLQYSPEGLVQNSPKGRPHPKGRSVEILSIFYYEAISPIYGKPIKVRGEIPLQPSLWMLFSSSTLLLISL